MLMDRSSIKASGCELSSADISAPVARTIGRPFQRGVSPNPGGRSKVARDIQALAQQHGPAAISTLAQALKSRNERVRVAAAAILLDRGYGRAPQTIATEGQTPLVLLHLAAATAAGAELQSELGERRPVASAELQSPTLDLLSLPPPSE
jgi:hypothetical protein